MMLLVGLMACGWKEGIASDSALPPEWCPRGGDCIMCLLAGRRLVSACSLWDLGVVLS